MIVILSFSPYARNVLILFAKLNDCDFNHTGL